MSRPLYAWMLIALATSLPVVGGEYVVLSNGFRLRAERHEIAGSRVRLYSNDGLTEVPAAVIASFEIEEASGSRGADPATVTLPILPPDTATLVRDAARRTGLPPALVESVARVESNLRQDAVSAKGAVGVMQLMPATARALEADPHDTAQNIDAGARLLRGLLIRYDGDVVKALSAYNAGSGAVDRYRGMPPYAETRDYVDKVIRAYIKEGRK